VICLDDGVRSDVDVSEVEVDGRGGEDTSHHIALDKRERRGRKKNAKIFMIKLDETDRNCS
jgi:hypothetical protein